MVINCSSDKIYRNQWIENNVSFFFWLVCVCEAVQDERGPRKHKSLGIERIDELHMPRSIDTFHLEILTQILIGCIKQAKANDSFRLLNDEQKKTILAQVWCECFVLRASHWSIDISFVIERCNDSTLKSLIENTRTLNADLIELSLLETLILCRKGNSICAAKERKKDGNGTESI